MSWIAAVLASTLAAAAPSASGASATSVLGTSLAVCSTAPLTGYFRDGRCVTGPEDRGTHVVCAEVSERFLEFTRARGNDLQTPAPRHRFPGLVPGDRWCLCAARWREALEAGVAPPVVLDATETSALRFVSRAALERGAVDQASPSRATPSSSSPK